MARSRRVYLSHAGRAYFLRASAGGCPGAASPLPAPLRAVRRGLHGACPGALLLAPLPRARLPAAPGAAAGGRRRGLSRPQPAPAEPQRGRSLARSRPPLAPVTVLTPTLGRAMLRATLRGATDGPLEPAPVRTGRGRRWARAAGGVRATVADAGSAEDPPARVSRRWRRARSGFRGLSRGL